MATIQRFEDLIAWQKARELAAQLCLATREDPFKNDPELAQQLQRAAIHLMAVVAQGFSRRMSGDLRRYLADAVATSAQLRSSLYLALDLGCINQTKFDGLLAQAEQMAAALSALQARLAKARSRQPASGTKA